MYACIIIILDMIIVIVTVTFIIIVIIRGSNHYATCVPLTPCINNILLTFSALYFDIRVACRGNFVYVINVM